MEQKKSPDKAGAEERHEMLTALLTVIIFVLGFMVFHYWLSRGALISYVIAKGYPLPDDYGKWAEWYLKKSLGLTADLPDRL